MSSDLCYGNSVSLELVCFQFHFRKRTFLFNHTKVLHVCKVEIQDKSDIRKNKPEPRIRVGIIIIFDDDDDDDDNNNNSNRLC